MVVQYLGQEVLNRQIQGPDVRIMYLSSSVTAPTPSALKDRFPRIPLPEPPSTLQASQELQALFTLLPFMERGVVLTSTAKGVYGKRFCQGRVFWTGAHTTTPGLHKMERNTEPVLLFSKDAFTQREFKNAHLYVSTNLSASQLTSVSVLWNQNWNTSVQTAASRLSVASRCVSEKSSVTQRTCPGN